MAATGTLGATLSVATAPLASIGTDQVPLTVAAFNAAGITYTQVGTIENMGEFGRLFETVTFNEISSGRTQKLKGPYNDGQIQLGLGTDLTDAGQALLFSYGTALNQDSYAVQINVVGGAAAWAFIYFGALIMSFRLNMGQANSVIRATVQMEVNTEVFFATT